MDAGNAVEEHSRERVVELLGLIHAASAEFRTRADATARSVGETFARTQVLSCMVGSPRTLSSVARHLGVARQSVRPVMSQLVERGLVERCANPSHKTASLFVATTEGERTIQAVRKRATPTYDAILEELNGEELDVLVEQLQLVLRLARDIPRTPR